MCVAFSCEFRKWANHLEEMKSIIVVVLRVRFICLDVANCYSEWFVTLLKLIHAKFPNIREHSREGWWKSLLSETETV